MGRKRSCNNEEENTIRKKIARLQERLNKTPKRRRIFIESSSEGECSTVKSVAADTNVDETPSPQIEAVASTKTQDETVDEELESDILILLGDAPKTDVAFGPAVHKDIATRWEEILKKGLPKEVKDKILKEYLIPVNCNLLLAPELNPEAKAALPDLSIKRDAAISSKQLQLGTALGALAIAIDKLIKGDTKQNILKPLSDAGRVLCDNHFGETRIRRNFVVSTVNSSLKDALIDAPRDKYLFGENVSEKLKAAKNIQRSGEELKAQQKIPFNKNNFIKKNNLNYQHRKTFSRVATPSARGGSTQRPVTRNIARQQQQHRAPQTAPRRDRSPVPPRRSNRR